MNALKVRIGAACFVALLVAPLTLVAKPRVPMPPLPQTAPPLCVLDFDAPYWNGATNADLSNFGYPDFVESFSGYALRRYADPANPFLLPALNSAGQTN